MPTQDLQEGQEDQYINTDEEEQDEGEEPEEEELASESANPQDYDQEEF